MKLIARIAAISLVISGTAFAQWVSFTNQTALRISAPAGVTTSDPEEKDYAWGDLDNDGDTDLVVVRKTPFTFAGGKVNVLLMNENGVLTDRTALYAQASDVGGDLGFNTETNDRDVFIADLNNDGWLDVVTATTISDGLPKHIGHPRVYINLKDSPPGSGNWQGLRFENSRIPQMLSKTGVNNQNPRFCSLAVGDVTGDGYADIVFGDYDTGEVGPAEAAGNDFDNKLLINQGAGNPGFFTDETNTRMGTLFNYPTLGMLPFSHTTFGAASIIADMNGDGLKDIVKQTALTPPQHVAVMRNPVGNPGMFDHYKIVNSASPYFVSAGDLNNDNRLDLITTDDNADQYLLNTGNDANGSPNFSTFTFAFAAGGDDGFGSQSIAADLNNDGWKDVLISDVDVDGFGCGRRAHIYHNLGNAPNVTIREESPSVISTSMLTGTHNIAAFDINGDGWNDLVIGRCNSTEVWINNPPIFVTFSYPGGRPASILPNQTTPLQVQMDATGGTLAPATATLFTRVNLGAWTPVVMNQLAANLFEGTLPAVPCGSRVDYYASVQMSGGATFVDPVIAPSDSYAVVPANGNELTQQDFELNETGWTTSADGGVTGGQWVRVDPNGTVSSAQQAQPEDDADLEPAKVLCFVTGQGTPGGAAGAADVDGGGVNLISPAIDLTSTDAAISYYRWFFGGSSDSFEVAVSNNNGSSWVVVETLTATANSWVQQSFRVSDFFPNEALTANVRVRFRTTDAGTATTCEGAVDRFDVNKLTCFVPSCACFGDLNLDSTINGNDIDMFVKCVILGGSCPCGDFNASGSVESGDVADFTDALLTQGACPP